MGFFLGGGLIFDPRIWGGGGVDESHREFFGF